MEEDRYEDFLLGLLVYELDVLLYHPLDLLVEALDAVVGVYLGPQPLWETVEGEYLVWGDFLRPFPPAYPFSDNQANLPR